MATIIFNDVHIGVRRTGGTTPRTALALRNWLRHRFETELMKHTDKDVIINGDLFDGFNVDTPELIETMNIFKRWLDAAPKRQLHLSGGNHDFSARGGKVSSFELLGQILQLAYPFQVEVYMDGLDQVGTSKLWILPHCLNQDLFDLELDRALENMVSGTTLFLHCNYDNNFAIHSDHSLNLSAEQATRFISRGVQLIIAHEHIKRVLRNGHLYITGNQFPTSVSDCLDDNGAKFAHILEDDGTITPIETWTNEGGYIEVDWTQINEVQDELFVRVSGNATQAASEEVIDAIAKFRSSSDAFVITNAVRIEGLEGLDGFEEISLEDIKGFDVAAALMEKLDPREQVVIQKLLEMRDEN